MSKEYIPAIDGMRAIAIGLVIASHFGAERIIPGGFGVTLFFFISGYLITGLLIQEDSAVGKIAISSFYIRQFLRLGPALVTMVAVVSAGYFLQFGTVDGKQILASLFYYTNFYIISGGTAPMPLWPLWSLAVEEHYYLAYPLIFALVWKYRERFLTGLVALTVIVLLWRIALVVHWHASVDQVYLGTDTRIDSVLYGAILAVMLKTRFAVFAPRLGHWAAVAAGTFLLLITFVYRDPIFRETFRYSLQGIALLPLFYAAVFVPQFLFARRVLESPAMIWIGRLSYSLYLYHLPVLIFLAALMPKINVVLLTFISLPALIVTAAVSYYCVERPFQKLRNKFRAEHSNDYPAQEILIVQPKS